MTRLTFISLATAASAMLLVAGCQNAGGSSGTGLCASVEDCPIIPDGVVSRAITWENRNGEPGAGGQAASKLGVGRKGSPCIPEIKNGETATLMDIDGCGVIRHIWITTPEHGNPLGMRNLILRMYWDGSAVPSVEAPLGDFFGVAHGRTPEMANAFTTMTLGRGFNCFFPMPFATHARITVTNDKPDGGKTEAFFFQIDYELRDSLPPNTGRFHAQFRRQNPTVKTKDYVVLDGVEGPGMFIGCVIGIRPLMGHWWGEGEMKFYIDGDEQFPTVCGTGTEDYFCAAWGMGKYITPYHGCPLYQQADDFFKNGLVSMYRFHGLDPVYFQKDFKATIQQIGWHEKGLTERSDDWCSVAYWYQRKPVSSMPPLPVAEARTADLIPPKADK